jgi:hypothetical protein
LQHLWPLFGAGQTPAFASALATALRAHVAAKPDTTCVVLAQASMEVAGPLLADLNIAVLASPELAFRAALASC